MMVDTVFLMFGVAIFVAVALGLESAFMWWNTTRGPEAQRISRRLRAASAGAHGQSQLSILKQRALSESSGLDSFLILLPRIHSIDRALVQSGLNLSVGEFVGITSMLFVLGFVSILLSLHNLVFAFLIGLVLAALPLFHVLHARSRRLAMVEQQLPDAIDLMSRALRAGHALPAALQMVGEEMRDPLGGEFKVLFDEVNYGVSVHDAMLNLLTRLPTGDLRYLVVAILIQRETGGNLAELLDNISSIVRQRLVLMGEVRTLSAEGRMSAWILSILPFAAGVMIQLANPGFLKVLWTDPFGIKLVYGALCLMAFGIWWMTRIIKIHV
ncbi:type II secretion system F family protein [Uliginosibacterium sp. 31-16]|uniref:type II secretion system F family protein n=1 Tax=Uliginosibacterium sp. 31-16 TaxID=3068315 RepID=UPI00273DB6F6|nr:type II secretion system F family protein [Uliginosibacterium sp. 31-16]MDP5238033.1 type II secretion system F family protein [Uliginosibacterium sp. 31-16]